MSTWLRQRKTKRQSVALLPNLPPFHLMYSAGSHYRVGGFTTVPSLLSSSQSLLSDSSLCCLSFLFLDPQCVVNRTPVLSGCLHILSFNWSTTYFPCVTTTSFFIHFPPSETILYNLFFLTLFDSRGFSLWLSAAIPRSLCTIEVRQLNQGPLCYCRVTSICVEYFIYSTFKSNSITTTKWLLVICTESCGNYIC